MTRLRLRIHKHLESDLSQAPKVFASVVALSKSGKRKVSSPARQELVPISDRPDSVKIIEVQPGRYYVEAVLPSGEQLSEDVTLKAGETKDIVLKAEDSPTDWLSWQQLAGNVQRPAPAEARRASRLKEREIDLRPRYDDEVITSIKPLPRARASDRGGRRAGINLEEFHLALSETAAVDVGAPIYFLTHPSQSLLAGEQAGDVWTWLPGLAGTPFTLIRKLNANEPPAAIPATMSDDTHGVFRVSWEAGQRGSVYSLKELGQRGQRLYLAVPRESFVELLVLPMPWKVLGSDHEADIEVAVQEPDDPLGFCSSGIVRDEEMGMLLSYLSSGALSTARQMAESAREKLFYKHSNPFAAVAGAYALVGTAHQASPQSWHNWVQNLMNKVPGIPDGAIQWGQLMMRMRRNADDIAEAKRAFKLAYSRGLPFYSLGMKWLLEGLEWAARDDAQAREMLEHVRFTAWRTNYQQPFTTLRVGGVTDV